MTPRPILPFAWSFLKILELSCDSSASFISAYTHFTIIIKASCDAIL